MFAQWVNSYKRLVPGFEAPVYVAWSQRNRSALIRIPLYKPGSEQATRAEIRCPDPACNPYLTFAALLHAGLEGIEKGYELEPPMETNLYHLTAEERRDQGIVSLPETLGEAIDEFAASDLMRRAFGDHIFDNYVKLKRKEWDEYRVQLTQWELDRYLAGALEERAESTRGRPGGRSPSRRRRSARSSRPGTSRRRRAKNPERTDRASGSSGEVPYIGHSTVPTTRPFASATRKPAVARRSTASALTVAKLFPVYEEIPRSP